MSGSEWQPSLALQLTAPVPLQPLYPYSPQQTPPRHRFFAVLLSPSGAWGKAPMQKAATSYDEGQRLVHRR